MTPVEILEDTLAKNLGRKHCIATGRGATAIWIGLAALGVRSAKRKVILPATLCTSPPAVVRLAGFEPVFCDVNPLTGNIDPRALSRLLENVDDALCVIAAHLYGQPAPIAELDAICQAHRVALMEDAAQAYGATIDGRRVGGFGDLSVVSFGHTKILDAGGGGAVLTDNASLAETLRELADELSEPKARNLRWGVEYRQRYYELAKNFNIDLQARADIEELCMRHPAVYRYGMSDLQAAKVLSALEDLRDVLAERRIAEAHWKAALDGAPVTFLSTGPEGAPWRFNILIPNGRRDAVAEALRAAGFDASPWYPSVASFFAPCPDWVERWPGAARIEAEVLNLWLTGMDENQIREASEIIRGCLEKG